MWKNSLFATAIVIFGLMILLAGELAFLAPFRNMIFYQYGWALALYGVLLALNLYSLFFHVTRILFLKDTGRLSQHMDKQFRTSQSLPYELTEQIERER